MNGSPAIPPVFGVGVDVDLIIIAASLALAFFSEARSLPPEADVKKEVKS